MSRKQIIITSAGVRSYVIDSFRSAIRHRKGWRVVACDASAYAPGLHAGDESFVVPPVNDARFVDTIISIAKRTEASVLVPLSDLDLSPLAERRGELADVGALLLAPARESIEICMDKWAMTKRLAESGLAMPASWPTATSCVEERGEFATGLVAKTRAGSASAGLVRIISPGQLGGLVRISPDLFIQELLREPEIGLDCFFDARSRLQWLSAKRKIRMRAGETDQAILVDEAPFVGLAEHVGTALDLVGPVDIDVMCGSDGPVPIDINPRIGGGFPLAHAAGARFPDRYLAAFGESVDPLPERPTRRDLIMAKDVTPRFFTQGAIEKVTRLD